MILYPAIDLKDGNAVRLYKGEMDQATVFNDNPAAQALEFVEAGCEWLHLVDLNGAFAGEPVNAAPVEEILKQCKVPAQLGGGIRDMATIERWLDKGLQRVILGTVAVENPDLVREAAKEFEGHVAVVAGPLDVAELLDVELDEHRGSVDASTSSASSAMWKISGLGFSTPTTWESITVSSRPR